MKYLRIIPLISFTACLVCASLAISIQNWASMPSTASGALVASAIAFGVEGAKLFLIPFAVVVWRTSRVQSVLAITMGSVMTIISIGGITIWMDSNLSINSSNALALASAQTTASDQRQQALDSRATLLQTAEDLRAKGYLTKATLVIAQAQTIDIPEVVASPQEAQGFTLPFQLSESAHWVLLTAIACSIDLGGLLLVTILMGMLRVPARVDDVAAQLTDSDSQVVPFELGERHQDIYNAILEGKHSDDKGRVEGAKRIGKQYKISSDDVSNVVKMLKEQGHVNLVSNRYHLRAA